MNYSTQNLIIELVCKLVEYPDILHILQIKLKRAIYKRIQSRRRYISPSL